MGSWTDRENEILIQNYPKLSAKTISEKCLKNRTYSATRMQISKLRLKRTHSINGNYFSKINPENSYWAGFIAADGHIRKRKNGGVLIKLNNKDRGHLENFKKEIQFDGVITEGTIINKFEKMSYWSCLILNGDFDKISIDLLNNFNIPRGHKSLTLSPPYNLKNEDCIRSFIRGEMDGDGGMSLNNKNKQWTVYFNGTHQMLDWIRNNLRQYIPAINGSEIRKTKKIYSLVFGGNQQAKLLLEWLYKNSSENYRLARKHNLYLKVKDYKTNSARNVKYSSKFTGVSLDKSRNKWIAYRIIQRRKKYIGRFCSELEAANAVKNYRS